MTHLERIKRLQRYLKKRGYYHGAIDGIVGPQTLTAAERAADLVEEPSRVGQFTTPSDFSLRVSRKAIAAIVRFEISSRAYYERRLARPSWPGGASGVTIGIGYDLGYNSRAQILEDWGGRVTDAALGHLKAAAGIKGNTAAGVARSARAAGVKVPLEAAEVVFTQSTLPRFARITRRIWPGVERLPYDAQGALLSVVFNRGGSLRGARRREMVAIRDAIAEDVDPLGAIAAALRSMKRLWVGRGLDGLLRRRDAEARLVAGSNREYEDSELVHL